MAYCSVYTGALRRVGQSLRSLVFTPMIYNHAVLLRAGTPTRLAIRRCRKLSPLSIDHPCESPPSIVLKQQRLCSARRVARRRLPAARSTHVLNPSVESCAHFDGNPSSGRLCDRWIQSYPFGSMYSASRCVPHVPSTGMLGVQVDAKKLRSRLAKKATGGIASIGGRRHLSSRIPGSPGQKFFAAVVMVVLAAWGLLFGAVTLLLLPFAALGLYLMRNILRTGAFSRGPLAGLGGSTDGARFPGRGAWGSAPGGLGSGAIGGMVSAMMPLLFRAMSGGMMGLASAVPKIQRELGERSGRNAALSRALGGGIASFPSVNMSMSSFSAGGFPSGVPGIAGGGRGGSSASTPSVRARLQIVGRNGVGGWADVDAGEDGAAKDIMFGQMLVTLDDGRSFDLTQDSGGRGASAGNDGPVEAEFRDK